ncbi:tetratricopeptide repeat protein [Flectobacillus major]|uniref:tetratricopeptide repeat protein n=1 Tax=Flectobacillus major TaxID=103 RepID=UPI0011836C70|nr:hypothetical protein [Flectobacillus major]
MTYILSNFKTILVYCIKPNCLLIAWLILGHTALAQIKKDSLFLQYLLEKDQHREALTLLSQWQRKYPQSLQQDLDLNYWKGFSHYSLRQLDSSTKYFSAVPKSSLNYTKSLFFASISYSYLQRYSEAELTLQAIAPDSLSTPIKTFELAGIALLRRNHTVFDSLKKQFNETYYPLQKQQGNFIDYQKTIREQQKKSPLKAALFSAIIPGSGKIYAGGQLGQAISTFLQNTLLGLQAYEGLRKDGVTSPRFIVYGGLFSLFYLGNIWGSALSVKIKRQEFNEKVDEQILFDMHIPLRTIFN